MFSVSGNFILSLFDYSDFSWNKEEPRVTGMIMITAPSYEYETNIRSVNRPWTRTDISGVGFNTRSFSYFRAKINSSTIASVSCPQRRASKSTNMKDGTDNSYRSVINVVWRWSDGAKRKMSVSPGKTTWLISSFQQAKETILNEAEEAHNTLKEIDETIQRTQAKEQERVRAEKLELIAAWKRERESKKRAIDEEEERLERKKLQDEEKRLVELEEQKRLVEQVRREREETERIEREREIKQQRLQQEMRQRSATSAIRKFRERVGLWRVSRAFLYRDCLLRTWTISRIEFYAKNWRKKMKKLVNVVSRPPNTKWQSIMILSISTSPPKRGPRGVKPREKHRKMQLLLPVSCRYLIEQYPVGVNREKQTTLPRFLFFCFVSQIVCSFSLYISVLSSRPILFRDGKNPLSHWF